MPYSCTHMATVGVKGLECGAADDVLFLLGDEEQVGEDVEIQLFSQRPEQLGVSRLDVCQRSSLDNIAITSHQRHGLRHRTHSAYSDSVYRVGQIK